MKMETQKSKQFKKFCSKIGVDSTNIPMIMDWKDVCKALKCKPQTNPDVSAYPASLRKYAIAHFKWLLIITALNGGKKLDYLDHNQRKYWQYMWNLVKNKKKPSGFGFSFSVTLYAYSVTRVASRLCSFDYNIAKYALCRFEKEYIEMING